MKKKTNIFNEEISPEVLDQMPQWFKLMRHAYQDEIEKREMTK